ncbi:MAG: ATP-grasp domain-containing protein [Bacteroidales bacterium]|nr:ATP-grasp domain-containing protein [Bacteroidales bacterium]
MKKVLILIGELSDSAAPDELDVLRQARVVEEELINSGYNTSRAFMGTDLGKTLRVIERSEADIVFNLVESIGGKAELIHIAPALLKSVPVPFTGSGPEAMMNTSNKVVAKRIMEMAAIPTPRFIITGDQTRKASGRYIIKPILEDASVGINDDSIVEGDIPAKLSLVSIKSYRQVFAEEYIAGREFNLSVIAGKNGPVVLPPAEIIFRDFPEGKPEIIGYNAKWDESSFEYNNTIRSFEFDRADALLLEELKEISLSCWRVFGLNGYARVDFRVNESGKPFVLEVNANPCISPDAGFYAATLQAGMSFGEVIERILADTSV